MITPTTFFKCMKYLTLAFMLLTFTSCSKDDTPTTNENLTTSSEETNITTSEENNVTTSQENNSTTNNVKQFPWEHGVLKVSENKHFLQHTDGTGFFMMADTAWHLARKLAPDDIDIYLEDRKNRGFNVILFSAAELTGIKNDEIKANAFDDNNWTKPNIKYWENVDYIVEKAESVGLYVGILPAWDQTDSTQGLLNVDDATHYGNFIAKRYKEGKNIIWVVGGDTDNKYIAKDDINISKKPAWEALGTAIKDVVGDTQLITFHVRGIASSSDRFDEDEASWIDFNMIQSGHCATMARGVEVIKKDYNASIKPTMDAESRYEDIIECFYLPLEDRPKPGEPYRFKSKDVREMAYRQIFAGAFGHTYGHESIWHFAPRAEPDHEHFLYSTTLSWIDALKAPGAKQMGYIVKLMQSRDILSRIPDNTMVTSNSDDYSEQNALATRGEGYAFVYLPKGGSVTLNLGIISGTEIRASWFNPRTGETEVIETIENNGTEDFDTESTEDMILILDDTSKNYKIFK